MIESCTLLGLDLKDIEKMVGKALTFDFLINHQFVELVYKFDMHLPENAEDSLDIIERLFCDHPPRDYCYGEWVAGDILKMDDVPYIRESDGFTCLIPQNYTVNYCYWCDVDVQARNPLEAREQFEKLTKNELTKVCNDPEVGTVERIS